MFENLIDKYGNDFNWHEITDNGDFFSNQLKRELPKEHALYGKVKRTIAKCDSNDDVLFLLIDDTWAIVHLTYSKSNTGNFPKAKVFADIQDVIKYIEEQFLTGLIFL